MIIIIFIRIRSTIVITYKQAYEKKNKLMCVNSSALKILESKANKRAQIQIQKVQ